MDIGISLASATRLAPSAAGRHLIDRAQAASDAGLASLTIGDGHAHGGVGYLQNVPAMARLLAEWSGRPAGCLFLLPMWPPLLVAEQVGTLAALHDGPFVVQTGLGGSPRAMAAMGAPSDRRVAYFNECVRIIDALLAGDVVTSELYGFDEVSLGLRPDQPVEWWMGTMAPAGLDRAARFGAAWYASPGASIAELTPLDERYRRACAEHTTVPRVMLRRDVLVLRDGARAREIAADAVAAGYRGMGVDRLVVGDADQVADQLAAFAVFGVEQIVARTMGLDPALDLETIEQLGVVRARMVA